MFMTKPYNMTTGSRKTESCFAVSSFCARLIVDTVIAVSIFAILALISSVIIAAELSVIILAILSIAIVAVAVLLAVLIIENFLIKRPDGIKAN